MNKLKIYWGSFLKTGGLAFLLLMHMLYVALFSPGVYEQTLFVIMVIIVMGKSIGSFIDKTALYLFFFSLSYVLIKFAYGKLDGLFAPFTLILCPVIFYSYGKYLATCYKYDRQLIDFWLCVSIIFPLFLYQAVVRDIADNGFINITRKLYLFQGLVEDNYIPATLYGVNVSLSFAALAFLLVRDKNLVGPIKKGVFFLLVFLSYLTVIHLVTRTGIVVSFIVLGVVSMYKSKSQKFLFPIYLLLISGIVVYVVNSSYFDQNIIEAYASRQTGNLDEDVGGDRVWRWLESIPHLIEYPFGWSSVKLSKYEYVHNLWLDVGRETGIIPFILLTAASYDSIKDTFRLYRIKNNLISGYLIALFIVFFSTCMLEPMMTGSVTYVYLYCLFMGFQRGYIYRKV